MDERLTSAALMPRIAKGPAACESAALAIGPVGASTLPYARWRPAYEHFTPFSAFRQCDRKATAWQLSKDEALAKLNRRANAALQRYQATRA